MKYSVILRNEQPTIALAMMLLTQPEAQAASMVVLVDLVSTI